MFLSFGPYFSIGALIFNIIIPSSSISASSGIDAPFANILAPSPGAGALFSSTDILFLDVSLFLSFSAPFPGVFSFIYVLPLTNSPLLSILSIFFCVL